MAGRRFSTVDIAIASGDSDRLRKIAAYAPDPETRMLQLLVADLIDREARLRRAHNSSRTDQQQWSGAA